MWSRDLDLVIYFCHTSIGSLHIEDPKQVFAKWINKPIDIDNKTELFYYSIWIRILEYLHFFPLSQFCHYLVSVEMKLGIFSDLFLNGTLFLIQELLLTFVKFHNYVYNSYSDTSPMLSSLLTLPFLLIHTCPQIELIFWFWFISWLGEILPWVIFSRQITE